jgi:Na+/glutamate symporter
MKKEMDMLEDKGKLKTNNKKKKIIVTTAVVFITVGTGVYINHLIKISNYLSKLTYDIVQESYDN